VKRTFSDTPASLSVTAMARMTWSPLSTLVELQSTWNGDALLVPASWSVDDPVDPDQLIDLVDAALERPAVDAPDVKGVLLMHGWSVPVTLERYGRGPFELIQRAIASARYIEAELRALGIDPDTEWHP